jgi:hypothetical protein
MNWTEPTRCALCGHADRRNLRYALAHWREAEPGMAYEHIQACSDRAACRARVEQQGDVWPLIETNERISA